MIYAVRFTSLKGRDAGSVRTERYDTAQEARNVAAIMRTGGHKDAVAVVL